MILLLVQMFYQMFFLLLHCLVCVGVVGVLLRGDLRVLGVLLLVVEMVEVFLVQELGKLGVKLGEVVLIYLITRLLRVTYWKVIFLVLLAPQLRKQLRFPL